MTKEQAYLIRTVVNNLRYLSEEWHQNVVLDTVKGCRESRYSILPGFGKDSLGELGLV